MNWKAKPDSFGVWWVRWKVEGGYQLAVVNVFNIGCGNVAYRILGERPTWFPNNPRFGEAQWQPVQGPVMESA